MYSYNYNRPQVFSGLQVRKFDPTGLSVEDNFTERRDMNEFLRDGDVINTLFDQTLNILFEEGEKEVPDKMLVQIFNNAYKICWYLTSQHLSVKEVSQKMQLNRVRMITRNLSYCVAWSILTVYKEFYNYCSKSDLDALRQRASNREFFSRYREAVRFLDEPLYPIYFAHPGVHGHLLPEAKLDFEDSDLCEIDSPEVLDFINQNMKSSSEKVDFEDKDVEEGEYESTSVDEVLDKAVSSIKCMCSAIQKENVRLSQAMADMEIHHQKSVETMQSSIDRLRLQNDMLTKRLNERKPKVEIKEVVKVKEVQKEDPLRKILTWDTICEYAKTLGEAKEVQTILNMLNRMSSRNRYFNENLEQNIRNLEVYLKDMQRPVYNQTNNFNDGSAYNDIHDNQDARINTHGR